MIYEPSVFHIKTGVCDKILLNYVSKKMMCLHQESL